MPDTLLLFFSGAGSTKAVCEALANALRAGGNEIEFAEIDMYTDPSIVAQYEFLIIATPTYHNFPPQTLLEFIDRLTPSATGKRCFLIATYGLYPGNNLRRLAARLKTRHIRTVGHCGFRSPASDGTLMFPRWLGFMYRFEPGFARKIETCTISIEQLITSADAPTRMPRYKWYAPLDYIPNKLMTANWFKHRLAPRLRVDPERWDGRPIECPRGCWRMTEDGPVIDAGNCDFCPRCVHRTANKAVSYAKGMSDRERLSPALFKRLTVRSASARHAPH
jgi:flavodoxin